MFARELLVDLAAMDLIYSNGASFSLVFKLGFLDKSGNEIINISIFGNKNIEVILISIRKGPML